MVTGGIISTVAGNGTATFGGDNGPAISAQLNAPSGIALDSSGNLIIADTSNNVIRKVSSSVITTLAGNGTANYSGDNGPAVAAAVNAPLGVSTNALGQIFVADSGNNLIRALNPPCNFALTTTSILANASGGTFNIGIQAAAFCSWSISGLPDWVTLGSPASGTGSATVSLIVATATNTVRNATVTVAGISVNIIQAACSYFISPGGQEFTIAGGTGMVFVGAPTGCTWSATNTVSFVTLTGATSGNGNGTVTFQVAANSGGVRSGSFTVAGLSFAVGQQSATVTGLNFIGSMPHIAAQENWITTFTLVNTSAASTQTRLSLFFDNGHPLPLSLDFPQPPALNGLLAASIDNTIAPNATLVVGTTQAPPGSPVETGSAQLSATGATAGFAIFHLIPGAQEAVVPLETRNASSYLLAFDNTNGVVLGVAVANISTQPATIQVVIRDNTGIQIASGPLPVLAAGGHTAFVLSDLFPVTANKNGTVEFDTPSGGQISVLGIRTTPLGSSKTLTTIPALANVGTGGGSIAHIAVSNGWQTTFVLVNAGTTPSLANLNFFDDSGNPLPLSITYPQALGAPTTVTGVTPTLAGGAMLMVQANGPLANAVQIGSAQLTTTGKISGFVIFRYQNGQEAVVPLESRNAGAYVLAFDNTGGTATGVAVNSVSTQAVSVPVIVRNDAGAQIATGNIALAANGHSAFTLGVDQFLAAAGIRGTIEFDAPAGAQIGALGIRIPIAHTFTTLPALTK